jgi:hypothetical protein
MHGGKSLKGRDHPDYKDGKYSKYNPVNIAKRYEKALSDPNLLSIKHDIARTQALLEDTWDRLDHAPDAAKSWTQIGQIIDTIDHAFQSGDAEKILNARMQLPKARGIISEQQRFHEAKKEAQMALDAKRKQLESKARIEAASDRAMSLDEARLFLHGLFLSIDACVSDPEEKQNLVLRLEQHVRLISSV